MTPEAEALVKRLRRLWRRIEPGIDDAVLMAQVSQAIAEAAALIEAQAGEIDELRGELEDARKHIKILYTKAMIKGEFVLGASAQRAEGEG